MPLPERKTTHLRWGRVSLAGVKYFVTLCTQSRAPVLAHDPTASFLTTTLQRLQTDQDAIILAATIMPDHGHLLFTLGTRLSLGQVMAKFKSLARNFGHEPWHWQENGFEHRLRAIEKTEDYGFYIFMNPYAARLIPVESRWPWWYCPDPSQFRFSALLNADDTPPREWLREADEVKSRIITS
jgi:putative transposase